MHGSCASCLGLGFGARDAVCSTRLCGPRQATFQAPSATRARAGQQLCRACLRSCFAGQQAITLPAFLAHSCSTCHGLSVDPCSFPAHVFCKQYFWQAHLDTLGLWASVCSRCHSPSMDAMRLSLQAFCTAILHLYCAHSESILHLVRVYFPCIL